MIRIIWALLAICVGVWLRKRRNHFNFFKNLGIPGPEPNILFGNALEMKRKGVLVAENEWIEKYGRIYGFFYGYRPVLMIADTDLLKQIQIKDFMDFTDRGVLFGTADPAKPFHRAITNIRGKDWKELRSLITPSFTTTKLKMMISQMTEPIDSLLAAIENNAGGEFKISNNYQATTLEIICKTALGVFKSLQNKMDDTFVKGVKGIFTQRFNILFLFSVSFPFPRPFYRAIRQVMLRLFNRGSNPVAQLLVTVKAIIQNRKSDASLRRADLLQLLIDAQNSKVDLQAVTSEQLTAGDEADSYVERMPVEDEKNDAKPSHTKISDDDILVNSFILLIAGFETSSNVLSSMTQMLVNHPEVQEKVRAEIQEVLKEEGELDYSAIRKMKYMDCVISETLRMFPPAYATVTREANIDKTYGNIKIPKGLMVHAAVQYLHYDPTYWEDPKKFNPDRFLPEKKDTINPLAFQGFGVGPRNCLGMRFAQMEMKMVLASVLQKFRLEASENTERDPPEVLVTPFIAKLKNGVPIRAVPLSNSE